MCAMRSERMTRLDAEWANDSTRDMREAVDRGVHARAEERSDNVCQEAVATVITSHTGGAKLRQRKGLLSRLTRAC